MKHRSVRRWWAPWRVVCARGCGWFPCPDSVTMDRPGPDPFVLRRKDPGWNAPTAKYPNKRPLMTPGQVWRTRRRDR
jgi:hypothetical protein